MGFTKGGDATIYSTLKIDMNVAFGDVLLGQLDDLLSHLFTRVVMMMGLHILALSS